MGTIAEMLSTPLGVIEWFVYLLAAVMFVIGLHLMNSPKTARKGNMVSAVGMILAVVMAFIVLFAGEISNGFQHGVAVVLLIAGIIIGAVAGVVSAKKVKMTDMPQLVSVFNTVGGGAAALVALNDILTSEGTPSIVVLITAGLGIMIGSVTFSGSLIAAGKLQGIKWVKKLNLPGQGLLEHSVRRTDRRILRHAVRAAGPASAVVRAHHRVRAVLRSRVRHPDRRRRYAGSHFRAQRLAPVLQWPCLAWLSITSL